MHRILENAGLDVVEHGSVGVSDLQFALATTGGSEPPGSLGAPARRSLPPLPLPRWLWARLAVAVVGAHIAVLHGAASRLALGALTAAGIAAVVILVHARLGRALRLRHRDPRG
jgi:hypothetical protein